MYNKLAAKNLNGAIPCLCEIVYTNPDDSIETLHLTDNGESIIWQGNEYLPCAMVISFPEIGSESDGKASIDISNVDQSIIKLIRRADFAPVFNIVALFIENPLDLENRITSKLDGYSFTMSNVTVMADKLKCQLTSTLLLGEKFPYWIGSSVKLPSL